MLEVSTRGDKQMANIVEYLNWRGDLSFEQSPLNEIDGLILANLSYVPFETIVSSPWEEQSITLQEASELFWQEQEEKKLIREFSLIKMAPFAMRRMATTRRFQNLRLKYYQNSISQEEESQFSALCIQFEDDSTFVSFRGTDDTMIGWKENFRMCFETVPAQRKALDYLNYISQKSKGTLWLGGHSKGGNLAVYAGAKAKPEVQRRIQGIYNYDGPGFSKTMLASKGYQQIADRIRKFVPEASMIGMLLEHDENYTIISSEEQGIRQHDPISWRVFGDKFISLPERKRDSRIMDRTLHDWIYSLSLDERKTLVNTVFQTMKDTDIHRMQDFGNHQWKGKLWQMQKQLRKNPIRYQQVKQAGHQMMEEFRKAFVSMRKLKQKYPKRKTSL